MTATAVRAPALAPDRYIASRSLVVALIGAAAVELLLLRTVTRTFIHIPGLERYETPLGLVAQVGRVAYYLAVVLTVLVLIALTAHVIQRTLDRSVIGPVGGFLAAAVALRVGIMGDLTAAVVTLVAVGAMSVLTWRTLSRRERRPLSLFIVAFLLAGAHGAAQFASTAGAGVPRTAWLLLIAEIAALLGALLTPRLVPSDRRAAGIGAVAALLVFGGLLSGGASLRILMLWNVGLAGWFPDLVYAAAAGTLTYTAVATYRAGRLRWTAAVVLLTCGGIGLHSTYQSGLVMAALLVLVAGAPVVDRPRGKLAQRSVRQPSAASTSPIQP
ncbi:MAG: hypothetical protein R3320_02130 [Nitriliruptorales bacterium]|nr:hypothetical protein [Nitriliruptorales bacterium]